MHPASKINYVGSRDLHRDLRKILDNLEENDARYVLTIHSKPKAVVLGVDSFLELLQGLGPGAADRLLALQLGALIRGRENSRLDADLETADEDELVGVGV